MTIDGYCHCGQSKHRPFEDVLQVMECADVERAVLCQHLGQYDNSYLVDAINRSNGRVTGVCLVDPSQADKIAELRRLHASGCFRGVRLLADWLSTGETLYAEAVRLGMTLVVYAPEGIRTTVSSVASFAEHNPAARIVISHLGNPRVVGDHLVAEEKLLDLSSLPGVYVLLSGLSQFCAYPYEPLHDLVRTVVQRFGKERVLWGSNFPVCGDEAAYLRDLFQVRCGFDFDPEEVRWVTGKTAERLWFEASY